MKQRILTALVLAPLAICAVLFLPTPAFMLLVAAVLLIGLGEWAELAGATRMALRIGLLAATAATMLALWFAPQAWLPLIAIGVGWWLLAALWLSRSRLGRERSRASITAKLLAGVLMMLPTWAALAVLHGSGPLGPRWALFAVMLVWAADTFAYFTGSRIGGPKLAPSISPGKTWAGFLGGLAGAVLICVPALPLLGLDWAVLPGLCLLALATALASVLGDLFESMIKRHAGAKDSGQLFPGHGGMMDRIDSIVAALPVFALGAQWLGT